MKDPLPSPPGRTRHAASLLWVVLLCLSQRNSALQEDGEVVFERDVLPQLQRSCFECHGPKKQRGGLRLDSRAAAVSGGSEGPALIPGSASESELIRRISLPPEDEDIMPARGEPLDADRIELFRRWIDQGASWPESAASRPHWAYVRPERPPLPSVKNESWLRSPIDAFVLSRLEAEGLFPSPEAERSQLVRRLYLDLIGLPPSPTQMEEALDDAPGAWERLVDRLLDSPQFGVRWARTWLDCARYADSHGYQADDLRDLWAYRDWVVDALNADMPFDRFTIEQLAGDLLPDATLSQRIATGFNRCAPCNVELGSDPEETRVNQVFDRVNTLGTVWLGTTMECAQCHDHKYDPFSIGDYYGLFAFFNQSAIEAERGFADVPGSIQFLGPRMALVDDEVEAKRAELQAAADEVSARLATRFEQLGAEDQWQKGEFRAQVERAPRRHLLEIAAFSSLSGATHELLEDGSILLSGEAPDIDTYTVTATTERSGISGFLLEALTDPSLPGNGPGRGDEKRPAFLLQSFGVELSEGESGAPRRPIELGGALADYSQPKYAVEKAIDDLPETAWAIGPEFHEPHWALFRCAEPLSAGDGRLVFTLVQNSGSGRTIGRLRLSAVTGPTDSAPIPAEIVEALQRAPSPWPPSLRKAVAEFHAKSDRQYAELLREQIRLESEIRTLRSPTTLVMEEVETPRESSVLLRGDFRSPGERAEPNVPGVLPPLFGASDSVREGPPNRLDLARWLVLPENPLVARVTTNRWWSELMGHGLVTTPEDFGVRGDPPTHPELLDWLAVELMENGWSRKRLLRTIVLSATYRQSARITPELLAHDDANLLYARGPRARMDAEMIRDNALTISGLAHLEQGGPPIRPYQPSGLWNKLGGQIYDYETSPKPDRYRRGLYVVWKRSVPYPSFSAFDGTSRMTCKVKRARSNTALQALTLMNDPVYVEAAVAFAERVLSERPNASLDERIAFATQLALGRDAHPEELAVLRELYLGQHQGAFDDLKATREFIAAHARDSEHPPAPLLGWYAVCTTLLNLDETITK